MTSKELFGISNLLDRLKPPKETVTRIKEKPKPEISKKQLKEFKNQRKFYYFEVTGDTTKVIMEKGNWTDSFSDKTFSKLTYNWINETEFELVFLNKHNQNPFYLRLKQQQHLIWRFLRQHHELLLTTIMSLTIFGISPMTYSIESASLKAGIIRFIMDIGFLDFSGKVRQS